MGDMRTLVADDDMLVERAVAGDVAAFAGLVDRYQGRVYALACRLLGDADVADDAAQETFVRAYIHLAKYRPGSSFAAWLFAIAAHWCVDYQRVQGKRAKRTVALVTVEGHLTTGAGDDPEEAALASERRNLVRRWIGGLPATYRQVITLRYFQDLSYAEIGNRLGQPVSTVRIRLHRARQSLARLGHPDQPQSR